MYYVLYYSDYGYHFYEANGEEICYNTIERAVEAEKEVRSNGFRDVMIIKKVDYQVTDITP